MSVYRSAVTLFGGTATSQLIVLFMMPLLSRHYAAIAFGEWALFIAIAATLGVISALRLDASVLLPFRRSDSIRLIKAAIITTTATTLLLTLVLLVLFSTGVINQPIFTMLPLMVLLSGYMQTLVVWNNRNSNYKKIVQARIAQSAGTAALNFFFMFAVTGNGESIDLILSSIIGQLLGLIFILKNPANIKIEKNLRFWYYLKIPRNLLYRYRDFPFYSTPEALLGTFSAMLPLYVVNHLFSRYDGGQVALAWRFLMFPTALIGGAVSTVIAQRFVYKLGKGQSIAKDMLNVWMTALLVGLAPALVINNFGSDIFLFLFSDKWVDAGNLTAHIVVFVYLLFSFSLTSGAHVALRMQHLSLVFAMVMLLMKISSAWIYKNELVSMLSSFLIIDIAGVVLLNTLALFKIKIHVK